MKAKEKKAPVVQRRWLKRLLFAVYLVVSVGVLAEIGLRLVVGTKPSYYTGFGDPNPNSVVQYRYGEIRFNSDGYADDEFGEKTKPRIGYIGDSVCYGVGAGHGYRISELVESSLPEYEHLNFGLVASNGVRAENTKRLIENIVTPFQIDQVVYLLNLNDILPDDRSIKRLRATRWRHRLDWLRGKSYLYTQLRTAIKNYYVLRGYGVHGAISWELWPTQNEEVVRATAERVNSFYRRLADNGVELLVVLLPYEMQISEEAAREYAERGIRWEDGTFIDRGPQKILLDAFDETMPVVDAYYAFVDPDERERSRTDNGLGQYFVYNQGDRLDWNHPQREGHRAIAEYLLASGAVGPKGPDQTGLGGPETP